MASCTEVNTFFWLRKSDPGLGKDAQMQSPTNVKTRGAKNRDLSSVSSDSASASTFDSILQCATQVVIGFAILLFLDLTHSAVFYSTMQISWKESVPGEGIGFTASILNYLIFAGMESVFTVLSCIILSCVVRLCCWNVQAGDYDLSSWYCVWRYWVPSRIMSNALKQNLTRFLGTRYLNKFMSLMGIDVNPNARITNIDNFSPPYNAIHIDETFLAQDVHVSPSKPTAFIEVVTFDL